MVARGGEKEKRVVGGPQGCSNGGLAWGRGRVVGGWGWLWEGEGLKHPRS